MMPRATQTHKYYSANVNHSESAAVGRRRLGIDDHQKPPNKADLTMIQPKSEV